MREFGKGSFTLRQAPRPLRLIYAGFLLLIALGLLTQVVFEFGRIGFTPYSVALYYRGGDIGNVMTFPKTFGQLLEVSHAHAFVMAVVFLILAHLFVSTSASPTFKAIVLVVAFAGLLGDLIGPWLVRYVAPEWSWLLLASWAAQMVGNGVLLGVSGWECVAPSPPGSSIAR
jgi:hypothetical protein